MDFEKQYAHRVVLYEDEELDNIWQELVKFEEGEDVPDHETYGGDKFEQASRWSIYESDVDGGYKSIDLRAISEVKVADLQRVTVVIEDWDEKKVIMIDPTWKDVFKFFHRNNDGHHVHLEEIQIDQGGTLIRLGAGS